MPEYLAPGVYVEEISTGPKPIEGVSTSNAAFLGMTERGPEYVKFITSWIDYQRWYGDYLGEQSYVPFAVQGFFDNGGKRCFIGRIVPDGAAFASGTLGGLFITALGRGSWGNRLRIKVENASKPKAGEQRFRVKIIYYRADQDPGDDFVDPLDPSNIANPNRVTPEVIEDFDNLVHIPGSTNVVKVINSTSRLVRVWWPQGTNPQALPPADFATLPSLGQEGSDGDVTLDLGDFDGKAGSIGEDLADPDDYLGRDTGFVGLDNVDEVSIVCVPDEVRIEYPELSKKAILHCEKLRDRFAVCAVDQGKSAAETVDVPQDSSYAGFYYPWIRVYDPRAEEFRLIPPSGHVAGIFARTDIERGVHKAPANEVVRGAADLEFRVTKEMQDLLNPKGVNCIRDFRPDGRGIRLWGARTMSSDPEWKYVNVRRLFLFVEESIDEGTQWVVFEPNHEPTWARVRRSINSFLNRLWRNGALQGVTADEAFFVKCDRTTMTQDDIDTGKLICYIGIAPVKPAEFVIFRIGQKTLEAQS